jgi:DNA primase
MLNDRSEVIRQIKDAADLVALVQEKVKLRKTGSGWMGACPICQKGNRTANFSVLPAKGSWHCFGCGEGGDAIDFLQQTQGMTFEEALEELSARTGIKLPSREEKSEGPGEEILRALSLTQEFYVTQLLGNKPAMAYLLGEKRGLTPELIEAEGLGLAPDGWETTMKHLGSRGVGLDIAEAAGLITRSSRGTFIDFMRDRLTIPIRDGRGRIIAFAGRTLPGAPDDSPKYLNTRETPIFKKSGALFHLNRAKAFFREEGAVIVEGYFDSIAMCSRGIQTAVAPMGTSLTEDHLHLIGRWTKRITLAFDGDEAGRKATARALEMALPAGFEVRLLRMPPGKDPDVWAREMNGDTRAFVQQAPDWATFAIAKAKSGRDMKRMEDRLAAAQEVSKWIAYLPEIRQHEVEIAAAHELNVSPENLKPVHKKAEETAKPAAAPAAQAETIDDAVQALLAMAGRGGAFIEWAKTTPRSWWEWRAGAHVLETLLDSDGDRSLLTDHEQAVLRAAEAKEATQSQADPKRMLARMEREFLQREIADMTKQMAAHAMDETVTSQLQRQLTELRARAARLTRGTR